MALLQVSAKKSLAFAVAEQPDRISESKFTALLKKCFGNAVTLGVESALGRLAFEGLTHSLQNIKLRSNSDAAAPCSVTKRRKTYLGGTLTWFLLLCDFLTSVWAPTNVTQRQNLLPR